MRQVPKQQYLASCTRQKRAPAQYPGWESQFQADELLFQKFAWLEESRPVKKGRV
jgi:hypothetical protein